MSTNSQIMAHDPLEVRSQLMMSQIMSQQSDNGSWSAKLSTSSQIMAPDQPDYVYQQSDHVSRSARLSTSSQIMAPNKPDYVY